MPEVEEQREREQEEAESEIGEEVGEVKVEGEELSRKKKTRVVSNAERRTSGVGTAPTKTPSVRGAER